MQALTIMSGPAAKLLHLCGRTKRIRAMPIDDGAYQQSWQDSPIHGAWRCSGKNALH
jgi:hypothetical protein